MSLINFLNSKLKPSAECDAVWEDGYAASNLIADDAEQLSRGFMAFSVSKPPVEIVFDFPKAIDLKVIKLWNSNGAMRSTAFEVHTKFEGIWERVAVVRDLNKNVDTVTICYQSDYSSRNNANIAAHQQSEKSFFFRGAHKTLSNTNSIKITIRATQKCPPVLRKAEIWGLPARSLEKADRELVKTIWSEIMNPFAQRNHQPSEGQRSPPRSAPELSEDSKLKVPEEFYDEITWELMTFPTVLPSGKVVDQSTIDRHSEEEAKWGRTPSDPFTGMEFTTNRKAILNLALKARIEKYLMENSEQFKTVPRSLGSSRVRRSKNRHASQFASLCQGHSSVAGTFSSLSALSFKSKLPSATATLSSTIPPKRARYSVPSTAFDFVADKPTNFTSTATQTSATATLTLATPSSHNNTNLGLDHDIQLALQKVTRFTQIPPKLIPASCVNCKTENFAYEIQTCKHLVCRKCLVLLTQRQMCNCKVQFTNADVERYHKL